MSSLTMVWLLTMIVPLGLGLWAQRKVKSTFEKYSKVPVRSGMTGAQAAAEVVRSSGLSGVEIREVEGRLTDHYDPRNRTLNLSPDVGRASSVAALGVAAHEAGHAVQDARKYLPMRVRQTFVPVASIGSSLAIPIIFIGLLIGATGLTNVGLALFTRSCSSSSSRCRSSSTPRVARWSRWRTGGCCRPTSSTARSRC